MKSFYHYLMKYRHPKPKDDLAKFANDAYQDHSFPINSDNYDEVSTYLEMDGHYLNSMTVFDEAWDYYQNEVLKRL